MKHYIDAGTTYTKIIEVFESGEKTYKIVPSKELKNQNLNVIKSTGHMAFSQGAYENEIVALALGAKKVLEGDNIVLDLGSRDAKWVKYKNAKFQDMDWNTSCASATGATIEMLLKFYDIRVENLSAVKEKYNVTCGIFGLEKIMDDIAKGEKAENAISKFIHGIAFNAFNFTKKPEKIYLSGGFCDNLCFVESLGYYCEVVPLGRFVLAQGLLGV